MICGFYGVCGIFLPDPAHSRPCFRLRNLLLLLSTWQFITSDRKQNERLKHFASTAVAFISYYKNWWPSWNRWVKMALIVIVISHYKPGLVRPRSSLSWYVAAGSFQSLTLHSILRNVRFRRSKATRAEMFLYFLQVNSKKFLRILYQKLNDTDGSRLAPREGPLGISPSVFSASHR